MPSNLGQLTQLTHLHLQYNRLINLPGEIGKLINLTHLNLNWNRLEKLPLEMENLIKLDELTVPAQKPPLGFHWPDENFADFVWQKDNQIQLQKLAFGLIQDCLNKNWVYFEKIVIEEMSRRCVEASDD